MIIIIDRNREEVCQLLGLTSLPLSSSILPPPPPIINDNNNNNNYYYNSGAKPLTVPNQPPLVSLSQPQPPDQQLQQPPLQLQQPPLQLQLVPQDQANVYELQIAALNEAFSIQENALQTNGKLLAITSWNNYLTSTPTPTGEEKQQQQQHLLLLSKIEKQQLIEQFPYYKLLTIWRTKTFQSLLQLSKIEKDEIYKYVIKKNFKNVMYILNN
jgi:hypothetical protein